MLIVFCLICLCACVFVGWGRPVDWSVDLLAGCQHCWLLVVHVLLVVVLVLLLLLLVVGSFDTCA